MPNNPSHNGGPTSDTLACLYSVLRFCPYPETDEFVNVGIALCCPELGYLDFRRTRRRLARVNDFFPELDPRIFGAALSAQEKALLSIRRPLRDRQLVTSAEREMWRDRFLNMVRPREGILTFAEPHAMLAADPGLALQQLFEAYVERRFAKTIEYQETQMCDRLATLLQSHALLERYRRNEPVGDSRFKIRFPFVRPAEHEGLVPAQAIKALYLDKHESTEIFRHADSWRNAIRRLRDFRTAPRDLLFVLHPPASGGEAKDDAFARVLQDFEADDLPFTFESRSDRVVDFARS